MLRFDERVAIVTGAGRGVGRATALMLARRGASVVVNDLGGSVHGGQEGSSEPADAVVAEIVAAGGRAVASYASVSSQNGPEDIVRAALSAFGRIDIVINNAGTERTLAFADSTMEDIRSQMEVHYFGTAAVTMQAWPHLVKSDAGRVVNTTSDTVFGMATRIGYSAAKAAVLVFTRTLSLEGAAFGVKVNCVAPRAFTRMAAESNISEVAKAYMQTNLPPDHVANLTALLAHKECPVNGKAFAVGGGAAFEIGMTLNGGIQCEDFTPEAVLENIEKLTDPSSAVLQEKTFVPS